MGPCVAITSAGIHFQPCPHLGRLVTREGLLAVNTRSSTMDGLGAGNNTTIVLRMYHDANSAVYFSEYLRL